MKILGKLHDLLRRSGGPLAASMIAYSSATQSASGALITGSISFNGDETAYNSTNGTGSLQGDFTQAHSIVFNHSLVSSGASQTFSNITQGSSVSMASLLQINPIGVPGTTLWQVGGYSFTATTLTTSSAGQVFLILQGTGVFSDGTPNDSNTGTWTAIFTSATSQSGTSFSWNCSSSVTGNGITPSITNQPQSLAVTVGSNINFSVGATGTTPFSYQWKLNGTNITNGGHFSGAQSNPLSILGVLVADAGSYTVTITNGAGSSNSLPAVLTVNKAAPVVTWTNPSPITYGTPLGLAQLDATANVPGVFAYNPGSGAVLSMGTNILSTVFTPTDIAGYFLVTNSVPLVVNSPTMLYLVLRNGVAQLTLQGQVGLAYRIQSSPDLQSWSNAFSLVPGVSGVQTNFTPTNIMLFYRAVSP